jgi:hypothetical protein
MKKLLVLLALVVALLVPSVSQAGELHGQVYRASCGFGCPLGGIQLMIYNSCYNSWGSTRSNSSGFYAFYGVTSCNTLLRHPAGFDSWDWWQVQYPNGLYYYYYTQNVGLTRGGV